MKAVLSAFFGIRSGAEHEADISQLKPAQVIFTGVVLAAIFVLTLVLLVRLVVSGTP